MELLLHRYFYVMASSIFQTPCVSSSVAMSLSRKIGVWMPYSRTESYFSHHGPAGSETALCDGTVAGPSENAKPDHISGRVGVGSANSMES